MKGPYIITQSSSSDFFTPQVAANTSVRSSQPASSSEGVGARPRSVGQCDDNASLKTMELWITDASPLKAA